jgi:periplasmic copper chaperone A
MRMPSNGSVLVRPVVLIVIAMLSVGACSSSGSSAGASAAAGATVSISDAWVRPPMGPNLPAAGYLTITGGDAADALVAAKSPIASDVQIHETMAGGSGMTGMQPVDQIDVPAGGTVKLEPGGYHLMLMGVTDMPAVGSKVQLTLTFEQAGDVVVEAEVKAG